MESQQPSPLDSAQSAYYHVGTALGVPIGLGDGTLHGIAAASRLLLKSIALQPDWWHTDHGPLIGELTTTGEVVALLPSRRMGVRGARIGYNLIHDSKRVPVVRSTPLAPAATAVYPLLPTRKITLRDIVSFGWRAARPDFLSAVLTTFGLTTLQVVCISLVAFINQTRLLGNALAASETGTIAVSLGVVAIALTAIGLLELTHDTALRRIATRLQNFQQVALFDRAVRVAISKFQQTDASNAFVDAVANMTSDLGLPLLHLGLNILSMLVLTGYLFIFEPILVIRLIVVTSASYGVIGLLATRLHQRRVPEFEHSQRLIQLNKQVIAGIFNIRLFRLESRISRDWRALYTQFSDHRRQFRQAISLSRQFSLILSVIVIAGAFLWCQAQLPSLADWLTLTNLLVIYLIFHASLKVSTTVLNLSAQWPVYQSQLAPVFEAVSNTGRTTGAIQDRPAPSAFNGNVTLHDVSFRYRNRNPLVLENVSLSVQTGEHVAIVGPSGSGKSTLLKLILGLETDYEGQLLFDDQPFANWNFDADRSQIGVALSTSRLQHGDILRAIIGFRQMPVERVWEALRLAEMDAFVASLPMKLHTLIDDGASVLSKGQRQRLLIARAILDQPPLVLLDNMTSGIDEATESKLLANLRPYAWLMVAQRASTVRHADRIYVLEKGRVIQHGTYHDLIRTPGYFATWIDDQTL